VTPGPSEKGPPGEGWVVRRRTRWRRWRAGARIGASAALLSLALAQADAPRLAEAVAGVRPAAVLLAFLLLVLQGPVLAARWAMVMRAIGSRVRLATAAAVTLAGMFFNQMLPTAVGGDLIRVYESRRRGTSLSAAISGVFLDRASGVVGLALMVLAGLLVVEHRLEFPGRGAVVLAAAGICVAPAALLCLAKVPTRLGTIVPGLLRRLSRDATGVFVRPSSALPLLGLSVVSHALYALSAYVLAVGLDVPLAIPEALTLVPPVVLVTMLPVSFAGWGLREAGMVVLLGAVGVSAADALAISVLLGGTTLLASLPGMGVWLLQRPGDSRFDGDTRWEGARADA
jgi:uncharacterized membrane protein YbhN (UPF0104 family)